GSVWIVLPTATTEPMLASTDTLQQVPLVGFLDAYPEPAFILCSNTAPRSSLEFIYGNSSLRELLVGHDESGVLDDQTFFSAVTSDEDIVWLSDPTQSGSQSTSRPVGDSRVINLRPAWLPRDHTSVDLELTPTSIDFPLTTPGVGYSSRCYVFTASPRKAPMNFLRSENHAENQRRKDLGLRLPDFPLMPGAVGPHIRSKKSKSDSSSMLSQSVLAINPAELPSRLVDTYPWETTPLGPRKSWPVLLELMVKYLIETPVSEDGTVAGIFNITWETTQKVIAERRLSCMSDLSSRLSDAKTQQQFGERTLDGLSRNPLDLPFIALYWCDVEEAPANGPPVPQGVSSRVLDYIRNPTTSTLNVKLTLAGSVGIPDDHPIAPPTIKYVLNPLTFRPHLNTFDSGIEVDSLSISDATSRGNVPGSPMGSTSSSTRPPTPSRSTESGLDLTKVFASGAIEIVDPLPAHLAQGLDSRGFKDLPRMVAVMPVSTNSSQSGRSAHGKTLPCGVLVVGLNTRRAYDADYASWLESVGSGLSNQLTVVLQREADMRMMEERERMDKAKTMFFTNVSHALFRSMAEKKRIDYCIDCDVSHEPAIYVDIDLWEKIICNLLSNAFKYTTEGTITLAVKHEATVSCVSVSDTGKLICIVCQACIVIFKAVIEGVGIPREYIDQIFDRFFRVSTNTAEGTGVGLSLTKELVSLHGGTMAVRSCTEEECPGHSGSTFTVTVPHGSSHLPAALIHDAVHPNAHGAIRKEMDYWMELDQPTPSTTSTGDEVEGESVTSSTLFFEKDDVILVVDDNADMRAYVRKIFTPYLTVLEAHDGVDALRIARSQRLNLVLCDVMMPKMDGPEFLRRLREERRTKLLPVIFVTASDDTSLFGGQTDGAVDYISKPFKVKDLLARAHLQLQLGKRRVKLEEDFEVRSHELQVLTDLSPVGIFRTDAEGRLTYANPAWHQIIGFPLRQDKDEWIDYVHLSSKEDMLHIWRACFESQKSASQRVQWKNDCWTHVGISPLNSPEGSMLGAFGAITDINEQHRAEEARIALAEERGHMAATRAEEAEAQRQLEVERRRAQELLIDVTSHELRQPVSAIIQNAEVVRTNMKGLRDLLHDCQRRKIPYSPTERMLTELEDDLQAMDSIQQCGLAQARIANDVLSLSRIQLNVLPIIPSEFDIRRETNQILIVFRNELISKNIDFKLDLGRGADMYGLQTVTTDRSRYAQIITNLMSNAIRFTDTSTGLREIKVSLELSLDPPSEDSCAVPPLAPKRVIRRKSGSEELEVYIYVSVQDSGPGLEKEDLALLFQRFQQGSNAHHVFGGSGLGLFVCRQMCHLMGGRIEVDSEPGQGATFRFFIRATAQGLAISGPSVVGPRLKRSTSVQSRASKASKASTGSGSRPLPETPNQRYSQPLHVLITEDNKINQTVLARQMKRAGFTFSLASNGLEALEAIERAETQGGQKFNVILMDLEMPVMDGFATTREIRRREAEGIFQTRSFIISITGNARSEQVESARDAGVDDVIIKPYQIDALISKMRAGSH
ncbi:hypothetical protein FRC11_009066, partial [Ceratobasidium sp. 423]